MLFGFLRNPVIQERYQEMRMEANAKFGVTVEKSVRDLLKMRNDAWQSGRIGEAIRAEELRLKATGLLVNKSHIMHEDMNGLNREQILEKLNEFKSLAEGRMKNVTPEEDVRVKIGKNSVKDASPKKITPFRCLDADFGLLNRCMIGLVGAEDR